MLTRPRRQMPPQPSLFIVMSMSVHWNNLEGTIILTKEKNSQKPKILCTLSIKEAIAKTKCPAINDFVDNLANVVNSRFLQNAKNQLEYKNRALTYYYRLFFYLL